MTCLVINLIVASPGIQRGGHRDHHPRRVSLLNLTTGAWLTLLTEYGFASGVCAGSVL
ncbi:hypothetical protein AALO_G00300920 [Alosa alosa]|uniref:Uncharacterized protein n=1 Tax=Alosa alosa TaxID=278164 RepID=A0AAV6FJ35_9TELE|nr:hypothetical protein AALO_G00300920 [Alosa alosa]